MTEIMPDTIRRLYTDPAEYIDSDHPSVERFAVAAVPAGASDREKASLLYTAVRDGIRYNPYVNMRTPETFRASSVLAAKPVFVIGGASLYAAAWRYCHRFYLTRIEGSYIGDSRFPEAVDWSAWALESEIVQVLREHKTASDVRCRFQVYRQLAPLPLAAADCNLAAG